MCTVMVKGPPAKDLYGYRVGSRGAYGALLSCLNEIFEKKVVGKVDAFVSCGMQGADWVFFEAAEVYKQRHPGVRNYLFEPFAGIQTNWKDYGLFTRSEYEEMRKRAALAGELVCCGEPPSSPREYGLALRGACEKAASLADVFVCIARWSNGAEDILVEPGEVRSFAKKQISLGKRVILVHPETLYICEVGRERVAM